MRFGLLILFMWSVKNHLYSKHWYWWIWHCSVKNFQGTWNFRALHNFLLFSFFKAGHYLNVLWSWLLGKSYSTHWDHFIILISFHRHLLGSLLKWWQYMGCLPTTVASIPTPHLSPMSFLITTEVLLGFHHSLMWALTELDPNVVVGLRVNSDLKQCNQGNLKRLCVIWL